MVSFVLLRTSYAFPEQYDVMLHSKKVGYLRVRHGWFRADYPYIHNKILYESPVKGDGIFDEDERDYHITKALKCIAKELDKTFGTYIIRDEL